MRFIYLDEAGIAHRDDEPWTVEAGVIVSPDKHLPELEERLERIRSSIVDLPISVPFHAMSLWHGSGSFPRDKYNRQERMRILALLAAIPSHMSIPIVTGWVPRAALRPAPDVPAKDVAWMDRNAPIMVAFSACVFSAERWLRQKAAGEVAMLVHEDTDHARGLLNTLRYFRSDEFAANVVATAPPGLFPFVSIKDELMFAGKKGSPFLQIADLCAFLIKRQLSRKSDSYNLYSLIASRIAPPFSKTASLV